MRRRSPGLIGRHRRGTRTGSCQHSGLGAANLSMGVGRSLQFSKLLNERRILAGALTAFGLNDLQNDPQPVEKLEQAGDDQPVGAQLAVA